MIMLPFTIHNVQYVSYMHTKGEKSVAAAARVTFITHRKVCMLTCKLVISSITVITVILGPLSWGAHICVVQTRFMDAESVIKAEQSELFSCFLLFDESVLPRHIHANLRARRSRSVDVCALCCKHKLSVKN